jgi:hypothetical protein
MIGTSNSVVSDLAGRGFQVRDLFVKFFDLLFDPSQPGFDSRPSEMTTATPIAVWLGEYTFQIRGRRARAPSRRSPRRSELARALSDVEPAEAAASSANQRGHRSLVARVDPLQAVDPVEGPIGGEDGVDAAVDREGGENSVARVQVRMSLE